MKPVFIVNGFLESGKTEFICYTLAQPYFQTKGKTLLIVCEEGEEEYDDELLSQSRTIMEVIDEEAAFTPENLMELDKKYKPERVIIEYNGMWNFKNMKLPWHWSVEQQIIFNRCDGLTDQLASYRRNVKAVNPQAEIIFEDSQGEVNQIFEEDLPYKLDAPIIELDNEGFGIWYLDCMDNLDRYIGKTIQFVGMVLIPEEFPEGYFIPGRMAMTCCAEDMAFLGFACEYDKTNTLTNKQWVKVTAKVTKEYFADYGGEGPVLKAVRVEQTKKPKEEVISFN